VVERVKLIPLSPTSLSPKVLKFSRRHRPKTGPLGKKAARQRKPTRVTSKVPRREANPAKPSSRLLRPRTAEEIALEQSAEQLALRIWAAIVARKVLNGMSGLMDELIQSHLLDDDDEEADEGWLDEHHKREKKFLDEAISDGLGRSAISTRSAICRQAPIQTLPDTPRS
jgi:hypothetical protein